MCGWVQLACYKTKSLGGYIAVYNTGKFKILIGGGPNGVFFVNQLDSSSSPSKAIRHTSVGTSTRW